MNQDLATGVPPQAPPATMSPRRVRRGGASTRVRGWVPSAGVVLLICLLWMIPVIGLAVSSLRGRSDIATSGWWTVLLPPFGAEEFTLSNYADVLGDGMGQAFVNTAAVTLPATVGPILAAAFAAYALTWMDMPFKNLIFALTVALMVVPVQATLIPLLSSFASAGLSGTYLAAWIVHAGTAMPLSIYIMRNFMSAIPQELIESARVDGASNFQIFWRFAFPLSIPAIVAFGTFQFLWVWNDFLIALVFLGGSADVEVMTLRLQRMIGSLGEDWYVLTAGAVVTMIVPLLIFTFLQRYFVRGLTAGALK